MCGFVKKYSDFERTTQLRFFGPCDPGLSRHIDALLPSVLDGTVPPDALGFNVACIVNVAIAEIFLMTGPRYVMTMIWACQHNVFTISLTLMPASGQVETTLVGSFAEIVGESNLTFKAIVSAREYITGGCRMRLSKNVGIEKIGTRLIDKQKQINNTRNIMRIRLIEEQVTIPVE